MKKCGALIYCWRSFLLTVLLQTLLFVMFFREHCVLFGRINWRSFTVVYIYSRDGRREVKAEKMEKYSTFIWLFLYDSPTGQVKSLSVNRVFHRRQRSRCSLSAVIVRQLYIVNGVAERVENCVYWKFGVGGGWGDHILSCSRLYKLLFQSRSLQVRLNS